MTGGRSWSTAVLTSRHRSRASVLSTRSPVDGPDAIGAGHSLFARLDEHLKLDLVEEQRFRSGALAQILVPRP